MSIEESMSVDISTDESWAFTESVRRHKKVTVRYQDTRSSSFEHGGLKVSVTPWTRSVLVSVGPCTRSVMTSVCPWTRSVMVSVATWTR